MKAFYTLIVVLHISFAILLAEDPYSINQSKNNLQYLNFVSENVGWVFNLQNHGTEILKTTDGGKNWFVQKKFDSDLMNNVNHVKFFDENTGFLVFKTKSSYYTLYTTEDGGDNWTEISLPSTKEVKSIHFFNKDIFWISQDGLYKTIDGGKSWHFTHDNSYEFKSLQFFGLMDGWALDKETLLITTDAGLSWNKTNHKFGKIQLIDGNTGYAGFGHIYRTDNFGASWKLVIKIENYYTYRFVTKDVGFYISNDGLFKTTNGGKSWFIYNRDKFKFTHYDHDNKFEICPISERICFILQNKISIISTEDDGKNWEIKNLGALSEILDIKGIGDKKLIVCGKEGLIGRTTDGGEIWDFRNDITHSKLRKIQIINSTVYIQGDSATFLKSTDFGENWQKLQLPDAYIYREEWYFYPLSDSFHFRDEKNGWIVGKGGVTFKTTNGGESFEVIKFDVDELWDVLFIDENRGFMIGSIKGEYSYDDVGVFFTTTNGGKDWQHNKGGFANFKYYNQDYLIVSGGYPIKYDIKNKTFEFIYEDRMQRNIEGIFVLDINTIWGWSTINTTCTFFKTTNGGKDWSSINNFGFLPQALYFTDVNNGWMVYGSNIIRTNNGGFRSLSKPILHSPANNSTIPKDSLILKFYTPDLNSLKFEMQISEDSSFSNIIPNIGDPIYEIGRISYLEPNNLRQNIKYYWRLRKIDYTGENSFLKNYSPWSEIWSFDIRWGNNSKVKLISPLGVETKTILLDLKWNKLEYADNYRVQLSRDSTFQSLDLDSITSSDIIQKAKFLKTNETYYWRVKAYNSVDSTVWSDVGYFKSLIVSSVDIDDESELSINPNPAGDYITIQFSKKGLKPFAAGDKVQIFDVLGIEVGQSSLIDFTTHKNSQSGMIDLLSIDISHLPTGVYFIRIGDKVEKFVKM